MNLVVADNMAEFRKPCEQGTCVEAAAMQLVVVRDSKSPDGPLLVFSRTEWKEFIGAVKDGLYDVG